MQLFVNRSCCSHVFIVANVHGEFEVLLAPTERIFKIICRPAYFVEPTQLFTWTLSIGRFASNVIQRYDP